MRGCTGRRCGIMKAEMCGKIDGGADFERGMVEL